MAAAHREDRRRLALDVRGLIWYSKQKFDADRYIRTGVVMERKAYPLPDTPAIRAAREECRRERERLRLKGVRGGR